MKHLNSKGTSRSKRVDHGLNNVDFVKLGFKQKVLGNRETKENPHWLYVMQSIDLPGFIKIGISQNVGLRNARPDFNIRDVKTDAGEAQLRKDIISDVWSPHVRNQFVFSGQKLAKAFEGMLHHAMRDYNVGGEFFYVSKSGIAKLDMHLEGIVKFSTDVLGENIHTDIDELEDF